MAPAKTVFLNLYGILAAIIFILLALTIFIHPSTPFFGTYFKGVFWGVPLLFILSFILSIIALCSKRKMNLVGKIICIVIMVLSILPPLGLLAFMAIFVFV